MNKFKIFESDPKANIIETPKNNISSNKLVSPRNNNTTTKEPINSSSSGVKNPRKNKVPNWQKKI